jgi:hypothetical protein
MRWPVNSTTTIVPSSTTGVWALMALARLISVLPMSLTSAIANLNGKGVRLYDTMRAPDYPVPASR